MKPMRIAVARGEIAWQVIAALMLACAVLAVTLLAPTELSMGHAQRIVYIHVAVAWLALAALPTAGACGGLYLRGRNLAWDHWSQAALEIGWLSSGLTLVTGSLWARAAWGTWWTWDPRLTSALILWTIYSGLLLVRSGLDEPHRRARLGAVLAMAGMLDVPLVILATRWFRGVHPVAPQMEPAMRFALLLSIAGFTAFFAALVVRRKRQLDLAGRIMALEDRVAEG